MNHPAKGVFEANVMFAVEGSGLHMRVFLYTTVDISAGSEFFVSYGNEDANGNIEYFKDKNFKPMTEQELHGCFAKVFDSGSLSTNLRDHSIFQVKHWVLRAEEVIKQKRRIKSEKQKAERVKKKKQEFIT